MSEEEIDNISKDNKTNIGVLEKPSGEEMLDIMYTQLDRQPHISNVRKWNEVLTSTPTPDDKAMIEALSKLGEIADRADMALKAGANVIELH